MTRPPLVTFCSILGLFIIGPSYGAPAVGAPTVTTKAAVKAPVQSVAEREVARRQESITRANAAIAAGNKAMKDKDYDVASQQFRTAVDLLPESVSTKDVRNKAIASYTTASVRLAQQRIAEGRYADAESSAKAVLDPKYNPNSREALEILSRLEQPDYYNKTITPKFHANTEQVKQWLVEARGFFDTGRYDLAFKRYEQVLNVDPYNSTARKGQEEVNLARSNYAASAYDEARSRALWRVDRAWENPVRRFGATGGTTVDAGPQTMSNTAGITAKLNRIILPKVEFRDATVREAVEFLKQKSREFDKNESDPNLKGVNIVLQLDSGGASAPAALPSMDAGIPSIPGLDTGATGLAAGGLPTGGSSVSATPNITLSLTQVPLMEVLRYITQMANLKIKIDPFAVSIVPLTVNVEQLVTREWKVPPGFITSSPGGAAAGGFNVPSPRAGGGAEGGSAIASRMRAQEFLAGQGVQFPTGASANFLASSSRLIVRNTQDNLDLIDTIVEAAGTAAPTQVEIEAKFVEITQNNLKELSFDWQLGQFNIPGSSRVFGGGGTSGNSTRTSSTDFPFTNQDGSLVGGNALTGGNRTGSGAGGALSANAIDALLFPATAGSSSAAPGVLSLAGVFTDPQFQVVMRALNQKKGVDLLSSPRVTTKSGQRASIEIIREFRYPTEFTPPQIPQTVGGGGAGGIGGGGVTNVPITPTTPTSFETRNTGVTLEVEPVVDSAASSIDLNLSPQVVEFEGFINYGSPIRSQGNTNALGLTTQGSIITDNVINQPIFSSRKISTSVSIWDGQTVVLGGLMREDVQKVEDKVPGLGDVPLLGRLFRSSVDQHIKRNLIIFVTARLINPAGEPVNFEEEKEEVVEPLAPPSLTEGLPLPVFPK